MPPDKIRTFETGATRSDDDERLDYEGFLSPLVLERYAQYMHGHRKQADGVMRNSDNWQKGMPVKEYMKSKWRHFMRTWLWSRDYDHEDIEIEDSLCAELFNTMGMLHEILKGDTDVGVTSETNLVGTARVTRLLQGLLSFVRATQFNAPELAEQAMEYEASIEAILEQDLGQIAKGNQRCR